MTFLALNNEEITSTVTDNYIDSKHEYYNAHPQDPDVQIKTTDVWYAIRPNPPQYSEVDLQGEDVEGYKIVITAAWRLAKAGSGNDIYIQDRDDIAGLRKLLNTLEEDFDRRDMEALTAEVLSEDDVDNQEKDE